MVKNKAIKKIDRSNPWYNHFPFFDSNYGYAIQLKKGGFFPWFGSIGEESVGLLATIDSWHSAIPLEKKDALTDWCWL